MTSRLQQLSAIMERANARSLSADDRETIKAMSAEYRMPFRITTCAECWKDQVRLLMLHTRKLIKKAENK